MIKDRFNSSQRPNQKRISTFSDGKAFYLWEYLTIAEEPPNTFARLSEEEYRLFVQRTKAKEFEPGEMIFHQGDIDIHVGLFFIEFGKVRTFYISPGGKEITLAYWTPGYFVGGPQISGGSIRLWSHEAVETTKILFLNVADLLFLVEKIPSLAFGIIEGLIHKTRCFSALIQVLGTLNASERLIHLILIMADQYGVQEGDCIVVKRALTQEKVANMIGATRQWVSSSLKRLQINGLISIRRQQITILDAEGLLEYIQAG